MIYESTNEDVEKLNRRLEHVEKLKELTFHGRAIAKLMDYFSPPNLMAWKDDEPEAEWDIFIRRKGSDAEFGPSEWKGKP